MIERKKENKEDKEERKQRRERRKKARRERKEQEIEEGRKVKMVFEKGKTGMLEIGFVQGGSKKDEQMVK